MNLFENNPFFLIDFSFFCIYEGFERQSALFMI